jgi:hypothetical protein
LCALLAVSCGGSSRKPTAVTESAVVRQYALNLRANYQDVVVKLQDRIRSTGISCSRTRFWACRQRARRA